MTPTFKTAGSYHAAEVDAFREQIRNTFRGVSQSPVKADDLRGKQFPSATDGASYNKKQIDAFPEELHQTDHLLTCNYFRSSLVALRARSRSQPLLQ